MPQLPALPWIRAGVSAGWTANETYRNYQGAVQEATDETGDRWTGRRRATFLSMYSETRLARSRVTEAMNAPKDLPGGGLSPFDRQTTRPGGYGNWAVLFHRPIGTAELEQGFYFVRSDEPLTPQEVEDRVRADFEASATDLHGTVYRHVLEGAMFTGVERLVPVRG